MISLLQYINLDKLKTSFSLSFFVSVIVVLFRGKVVGDEGAFSHEYIEIRSYASRTYSADPGF